MNINGVIEYIKQLASRWALVALAALSLFSIFFIPSDYLMAVLKWIEDLGTIWGTLALLVVYVLTVVLFLPGFTLTIFSGYWCGLFAGTLLSWIGGTLGAVSCFLLGRWGAVLQPLHISHQY